MEYRRRRRRRRTNHRGSYGNYTSDRRGRSDEGTGFGGALLILLLTAGLIYLLLGTSIGTWIAQNVFTSCGDKDTPAPTHQASDDPQNTDNIDEITSKDMTFSGLEVFTLQMGVYSEANIANGLIASLKTLGAAGYVLDTGNGYRVLASCYDTEAAAKSVCERLKNQDYECVVYPLTVDEIKIGVSCDKTRMEAIHTAVNYSYTVISDLSKEVLAFDSEERSVEYGHAIGNEMLTNVKNIRTSISDASDPSGLISLLDEYYMNLQSMLTTFISSSSDNRVEVSGMLKYLQLDAVCNYINMMNKISELSK